ncbi:MAG: VWA domain-containing protein [Xanthomonadales bacterium]|nr:VWA domain-containing protein [Xanthomonadales bacterium]
MLFGSKQYRSARIALGAVTAIVISASASAGGLVPPPSVSSVIVSPTEDYRFQFDPFPTTPTGQVNPHFYPAVKILQDVAAIDRTGSFFFGNPQGYDQGYEALGFLEPDFDGGPRMFYYWDCGDDCNGGLAQADQVVMPTEIFRSLSESCTRNTLGHELFHKIQRAYRVAGAPSGMGKWVTEGHARALQDKIYTDFDIDPNADCRTTFEGDVDEYLTDLHHQPLWTLSYNAALWWAYLMEQFGEIPIEPLYGVDFLVTWYDQSLLAGDNANSLDITNDTIQFFDPSRSLLSTYRDFVLANVIKDMRLDNVGAAFRQRYTYVDEQAPGQDRYDEVTYTDNLTISNGATEDTAIFGVEEYAVRYYKINLAACGGGRTVRVSFEPAAADPFFGLPLNQTGAWGLVVGQSNNGSQTLSTQRPNKYYKKVDQEWAVEFFQPFSNPYESAYAMTTGVNGPVLGTLRAQCLAPPPNPFTPNVDLVNPLDPLTPGPPDTLTFGEVCAVPSSPLPGLDPNDYRVAVGGQEARIVSATPRDDGHCLLVEFPAQTAPGAYPLAIGLGENEVIVEAAVVHNEPAPNVMLALDVSNSMGFPFNNPKLDVGREGLKHLLEMLIQNHSGGASPEVGLVTFDLFESDPNQRVAVPLAPADGAQQRLIESVLDAETPSALDLTSPAGAIQIAIDEIAARGAPGQSRHLVLISDGGEDDFPFWHDVGITAVAAGINVHTVALGRLADQQLLFDMARSTGGKYFYVDMDFQGVDGAAMARAMVAISNALSGTLTIGREDVSAAFNQATDFTIEVPQSAVGMLLPAVQAAREAARGDGQDVDIGKLTLKDPEGTAYEIVLKDVYVTSIDVNASGNATLPAGTWTARFEPEPDFGGELTVHTVVQRDAPLRVDTGLARPETATAQPTRYRQGDSIQLWTSVFDGCSRIGTCSSGEPGISGVRVTLSNGNDSVLDLHGQALKGLASSLDGSALKGAQSDVVSASYSAILGAPPAGTTTRLGTRESISLDFFVELGYGDYTVTAMVSEDLAFSTTNIPDSDSDGLPNSYEARKTCLDPMVNDASGDPDADNLTSLQEMEIGTDPCNGDSDRGGELDGSEVSGGRQPLMADDDRVAGITFAYIGHEVTHDEPRTYQDRSHRIAYSADPSIARVVIQRAQPGGSLDVLAQTDATGEYFDNNLTAGVEYCYRLLPFDDQDRPGAPSEVLCSVATDNPGLPWGDVVIYQGRPRTDDPSLLLTLGLYNKPPESTEMRLTSTGFDTGWIPFQKKYTWQHRPVQEATRVEVEARFRDANGLQSRRYRDAIVLMPEQSLGGIRGRVMLEDEGAREGVFVWLADRPSEPPATTDADGFYVFIDVLPGDYVVMSDDPSFSESRSGTIVVEAGETADAGDVMLALPPDELFADGFEN